MGGSTSSIRLISLGQARGTAWAWRPTFCWAEGPVTGALAGTSLPFRRGKEEAGSVHRRWGGHARRPLGRRRDGSQVP